LHGALLDAQILLDVYLALTSGQGEIGFASQPIAAPAERIDVSLSVTASAVRPSVRILPDEAQLHAERLAGLQKKSGRCLWLALEAAVESGD
jgi:DNA polymerase-3 subunit epsilon